MSKNKEQIWARMNSIRNHYKNDKDFILHMDEWPKTVKKLIYNSEKLMIRFGLIELIPNPPDDEEIFAEME